MEPLKQTEKKVVNGVIYTGGQVPPDAKPKKENEPIKKKGGK